MALQLNNSSTPHAVCAVIFFIIGVVIYLPLCLYGIHKYFVHRNHVILKKHYSEINLYMVATSITVICILQPLLLVWGTTMLPHTIAPYFELPAIVFAFYSSVSFVWRCYMNYYTIQYSNQIDSEEWKKIINPLQSNTMYVQNNWFILNKNTYGNYKYWRKYIIIINIFVTLNAIILHFIYEYNLRLRELSIGMSTAFCVLCCIILTAFIYCKTPKYGDIFFIHQEIRYMIFLFIFGIFIFVIIEGFSFVFHDKEIKLIFRLFSCFAFITMFFLGILLQTFFVIKKNEKWLSASKYLFDENNKVASALNIEYQISINTPATPTRVVSETFEKSDIEMIEKTEIAHHANECGLNHVLRDVNGFDSFMFHLKKEFSIEILLSLLEITQFKESVYEYYKENNNDNDNMNDSWNTTLMIEYPRDCRNMPKSHIVYGELDEEYQFYINGVNDMYEAKKIEFIIRAYGLYQKYICSSAAFEINISHSERTKLDNMMNDIAEWISYKKFVTKEKQKNIPEKILKFLYLLFDPCCTQMHSLLSASFSRYQMTLLYAEFVKLCKNK